MIRLLEAYCTGTKATVITDEPSDLFLIEEGVRQDCVLSPVLLHYIIDWILKVNDEYQGVAVSSSLSVNDVDCADNVGILAPAVAEAESMLNDASRRALSTGLHIHLEKTKTIRTSLDHTPITLNGTQVEEVQQFK